MGEGPTGVIEMALVVTIVNNSKQKIICGEVLWDQTLSFKKGFVGRGVKPHINKYNKKSGLGAEPPIQIQ